MHCTEQYCTALHCTTLIMIKTVLCTAMNSYGTRLSIKSNCTTEPCYISVLYTLEQKNDIVQCRHYLLYTAHCTLNTTHCPLNTEHCTLLTEHFTLHYTNCIFHTSYCRLYSPQCTLHTILFRVLKGIQCLTINFCVHFTYQI